MKKVTGRYSSGEGINCRTLLSRRGFGKAVTGLLARPGLGWTSNQKLPVMSKPDEKFLKEQARLIVNSSRVGAGQTVGGYHNQTPYDVHVPGGNMGYPAYWVRDSVMMLGGDFISAEEVEGWIRLISGTLREQDWHVRPGVVVPAYAVPDHINFDGKPTFYPGNYETGDKQGGKPWGKYPPLDDDFYFVTAVYEHWKLTHNTRLFLSHVKTSSGEMRLDELSEKVFQVPPSDPATGLVVAGDVETENAKDFGFCDGVLKSGKLLFSSLLKFVAARQLDELFRASGQPTKAKKYSEEANRIQRAIPRTFFHVAPHSGEGWFHSATEVGNQPDVWGSAFAIWSGATDGPITLEVGRALARAYREKTAVKQGCVRHILTTDPVNRGGWQRSISNVGEYQNGGYWGTATGWYIAAVSRVDPKAAAEMAKDYIQFLRSTLRPDGMAEAWEWLNPDTGKHDNPLYVATVALPYLSLREAGVSHNNSVSSHSHDLLGIGESKPRW